MSLPAPQAWIPTLLIELDTHTQARPTSSCNNLYRPCGCKRCRAMSVLQGTCSQACCIHSGGLLCEPLPGSHGHPPLRSAATLSLTGWNMLRRRR